MATGTAYCTSCGRELLDGAKFCGGCRAPVSPSGDVPPKSLVGTTYCTNCGTANSDRRPSCAQCGHPLTSQANLLARGLRDGHDAPRLSVTGRVLLIGCASFVLLLVLIVLIPIIIGAGHRRGSGTAGTPKPTASSQDQGSPAYQASFEGEGVVLDPAERRVLFYVTNIGTAAGAPSCTVTLNSPGGTYHGFDIFKGDKEIPPGQGENFTGIITVTGQGAAYVDMSASTVTCE